MSGGAGIGGGAFKDGGSVTVNGGTVTAVGGAYSETTIAAGIGGGIWGSQGTLSIAADITVKSGDAADALSVIASAAGSVTLDGKQFYSIVALEQFNIVYMDGETPLNLAPAKYTAGQVCQLPVPAAASGYHFAGWYTTPAFTSEPVSEIPSSATGTQTFYVRWGEGSEGGVPVFTIERGVLKDVNLNGNKDITIPDTVTEIFQYVFEDCTALESVTLADSVKRIGNGAFQNCSNMTSIDFGNGLETIGESVFNGCTSLTNGEDGLYIPDSVTSIGANAFYPQCGVTKASLPGSMYNTRAYLNPGFDYYSQKVVYRTSDPVFYVHKRSGILLSVDPKANTDLVVPGIVTQIGNSAFKDCNSVASVSVPATVTTIESGAFFNCAGLTRVDIADGVTIIKDSAFQSCTSLASIEIPGSVTELGESVFWGCTSLRSITVRSNLTAIGSGTFYGTALRTVYVEKGDADRVKALVEATGYTAKVWYLEPGEEPDAEWPADTSTVAGQTAAEAFGVTGDLAAVDAKKLADWAKDKSVEFGGTIITDAYLLDCANTAAAVEAATETAKEAIKITAITFDEDGNPQLTYPGSYRNGTVVLEGAASLVAPMQWHAKSSGDKFFRTVLKP